MNKVRYGLRVHGVVRVFRQDKEIKGKGKKTFTVTNVWFNVSERDDNGEYFNKPMTLLFRKGLDLPPHNTIIEIVDAFPVITGEGDWRKIALMVMDWRSVQG